MKNRESDWPKGRVTGNSAVVQGYIIGALHGIEHPYLRIADTDPENGEIILEATETPHRFCVTIRQIGGTE